MENIVLALEKVNLPNVSFVVLQFFIKTTQLIVFAIKKAKSQIY